MLINQPWMGLLLELTKPLPWTVNSAAEEQDLRAVAKLC